MKVKITFLMLFFFSVIASAQQTIAISYDENIDLGKIEATTHFLIKDPSSKIIKLNGDKINNYKFQMPGAYHIQVVHKEKRTKVECEHNVLPNEFSVNVSPIKMVFLADEITFSSPIFKNKETSGIKLNIPIQIQTYNHEPISLNTSPVNSAGIGSAIVARLDKEYGKLPEGEHIITYNLNGVAHENSYLMFDFIDANGKIQSVAVTNPVTN